MLNYPEQEPLSEFAVPYHQRLIGIAQQMTVESVQYGDDPYQSLAVFQPETATGSALIMWHGGGWTSGYKEWMYFMAPALNGAGICFISAGYRLAPRHVYPACFDDCARAVKWVFDNATDLDVDPGQIFLSGHSAGGHLSSLLAVRDDWQPALELPQDVVRGCLPISGTYYFGEDSGLAMRPRFLGDADDDAVSPIMRIERTPPFLIAYGSEDFPHLVRQAKSMAEALVRAGAEVDELELPGCDHLGASLAAGEAGGPWVERAAAWIDSHGGQSR